MILRRMLAIWISKATCVVCKLAGKQGVTLAGKIALKIDPKILMEKDFYHLRNKWKDDNQ